jgi:hypothetical protein
MPKAESKSHSHSAACCFQGDGVLDAIRLMAERKTTKVVVLGANKAPVGIFRFEQNRITYEALDAARNGDLPNVANEGRMALSR